MLFVRGDGVVLVRFMLSCAVNDRELTIWVPAQVAPPSR